MPLTVIYSMSFSLPWRTAATDLYGGSFDARIRFLCEVVEAVRKQWPEHLPLLVRLSCVDWVEGGWTLEDTVARPAV